MVNWTRFDMEKQFGRITMDPAICHGKPTVRGLRYPVEMVLDLLSSSMGTAEILADYPDLEAATSPPYCSTPRNWPAFNGLNCFLHEDPAGCPAASIVCSSDATISVVADRPGADRHAGGATAALRSVTGKRPVGHWASRSEASRRRRFESAWLHCVRPPALQGFFSFAQDQVAGLAPNPVAKPEDNANRLFLADPRKARPSDRRCLGAASGQDPTVVA